MFGPNDAASLTLEELTWLSASTLIENQYTRSESPSNERGARALLDAVFSDSQSDLDVDPDAEENDEYSASCRRRSDSPPPPPISTTRVPNGQGLLAGSGLTSTPGIANHSSIRGRYGTTGPQTQASTSSSSSESATSSNAGFLSGKQPITPPPTPPRRHLHPPRYLSPHHDHYYQHAGPHTPTTPGTPYPHTPSSATHTHTPPSPSPSVSSSNLSSSSRTQTEWIYRRPKASPHQPYRDPAANSNAYGHVGQGQGPYGAGNGNGMGNNGNNAGTISSIGGTDSHTALLNRHRSASGSATASCSSRQVSRSPSIASSSYRTTTTTGLANNGSDTGTLPGTSNFGGLSHGIPSSGSDFGAGTKSGSKRSSKPRKRDPAALSVSATTAVKPKPRPSSPILISSTSQLVDASPIDLHPPPSIFGVERNASRSPSLRGVGGGGGPGLHRSNVNASVSSLQLQSSIRVSPLKNRQHGAGSTGGNSSQSSLVGSPGSVAQQPQSMGIDRSFSNTSTTTNKSTGRPIWTALRGKAGASTSTLASTTRNGEKNRPFMLKSIPSQGQISIDSATTPTFVAPPPSSKLPLSIPLNTNNSTNSPRTPTRVRHTMSGGTPSSFGNSASLAPPSQKFSQKDKDRSFQRRDKFASAPPIPGIVNAGVGAQTPSARCYLTSVSPGTPPPSLAGTGANNPSDHANNAENSPFLTFEPSPTTLGMKLGLGPCGMDSASSPCPSPTPNSSSSSSGGAPSSMVGKVPSQPLPLGSGRVTENAPGRNRRRRRSSSSGNVGVIRGGGDPNGRDRTASFTSQLSVATAHTAATTGTSSSASPTSSSLRSHLRTPTTTPSPIPVPGIPSSPSTSSLAKSNPVSRVYNFRRTSSNSSMMSTSYHLHGLGNGANEEKRPQFILNPQPPYQHRHQRQSSTSSSVSFNGVGSGSTAATAASVARSQAYAQLTGAATAAGVGLGMGMPPGSASAKRRRPSTSPSSIAGSGSETSSIHSQLNGPYGRHLTQNQGGRLGSSSGPSSGSTNAKNGSSSTLMPTSSSSFSRPTHSSSLSLSHYGNSFVTRTPRSPHHAPLHHFTASLPKSKSILTRTSSMSTKNSGCGGTVKSVKFVEIPEVHYRSGCYEHDGNEYVYGYEHESTADIDGVGDSQEEIEEMNEDDTPAVGAKGEGQEGMVLRECMGLDIEAIDMDIDTYLGTSKAVKRESEEKESKLSFKRVPGLGWGFLSRSKKAEREDTREGNESRDIIVTPPEIEQKKEDKTSSGFGLKRLMGFGTRKAPPPPLTISTPFSLGPKSPTVPTPIDDDQDMGSRNKQTTNAPMSPRKPISGPYVLGSHLPSRSPPAHSSIPSPSSSHFQQPISARSASSSNTSLNRMNLGRQHGSQPNHPHRSRSIRSNHRNPSQTTVTNPGTSAERPVGPNIAGTRPKGFVVGADVLSLNVVPLKNSPSYESFRSAKSYGGRSVRSEVGSVKSTRSGGGGSMRSFRTWMNKAGGNAIGVAVAE